MFVQCSQALFKSVSLWFVYLFRGVLLYQVNMQVCLYRAGRESTKTGLFLEICASRVAMLSAGMDSNLCRLRLYKSLSAQIRPGAWR